MGAGDGGTAVTGGVDRVAALSGDQSGGVRRPCLTLAMSDYDHVRDLMYGRVGVEGVQLMPLTLSIEEIFYRFTKYREWDLSEMSMGKYVSLLSQNDFSLTAIPVFPSRVFRHSSIYIRRDGPVKTPGDLKGKRIGLPEWAQTAAVYSRGMLMHEYGLKLQDVEWIQAGVNQPGRVEKVTLNLPEAVRYQSAPTKTLNGMLLSGEVDAVLSAHPPEAFKAAHPNVGRMFENYREVEEAYYRKTGIFPIMHTVAIRKPVLELYPWVAMNLFRAFEEAKGRSLARALEVTAPRFPVPWCFEYAQRCTEVFGKDLFPYGVEPNRTTLEAFVTYAWEQGVCHRKVAVEELFPPALTTSFKV